MRLSADLRIANVREMIARFAVSRQAFQSRGLDAPFTLVTTVTVSNGEVNRAGTASTTGRFRRKMSTNQ